MEPERHETYERIPWESLEKKGGDRQWLVYAMAGAVVLGALAYSFMRNQPTAPLRTSPPAAVATTVPPAAAPTGAGTTPSTIGATPSAAASPVVVSEADLYAVDPERLIDQAAGHAEWVAAEYIAVDGSEQSRDLLVSLLPGGVPLPEAPDGVQVFVDWAGTRSVAQTGPVTFLVEVLVRSLLSGDDGGFVRQPPLLVTMEVEIGENGVARVVSVPTLGPVVTGDPADLSLAQPPEDVVADINGEVAGGIQRADGGWDLVVVTEAPDGVRRPVTVSR